MMTDYNTIPITPIQGTDLEDDEAKENRCLSFSLFNPRKTIHRYFALIFMCFLGFGSYFCYDTPGALQRQLINGLDINTAQFANLYSWYSWPNVILCFFGGYLIDKFFGIRWGAIIFSFFILVGQLVFAAGAYINSLPLMYFGRFIFGIGGESLQVAQNAYAVSWFKSKELNMVFGIQLSIARVGSTVNFNLMGPILSWVSGYASGYQAIGLALFVAIIPCILSQMCAFIMGFFDYRAEKILKTSNLQLEKVNLTDVKDFPLAFWLLCLICVTYYVAIFPFVAVGSLFFFRKFGFSQPDASFIDSIVYIISAAASPIFGLIVDKVGRNISFCFLGIVLTLVAHILLALTFVNPWVAMTILGLSYSLLACALWPMIAMVIPEHQLGTAYGFMQSAQNLGLGVVTLLAGMIVDQKGYLFLELFFIEFLFVCIILTLVLFMVNTSRNGNLNSPPVKSDGKDGMNKTLLEKNNTPSEIST